MDTTVQEKAITVPTDAKLMHRARERLVRLAKQNDVPLRQSYTRLWHSRGKTAEAHDLLVPVYDWFTEGFYTADLKEAKALLNERS